MGGGNHPNASPSHTKRGGRGRDAGGRGRGRGRTSASRDAAFELPPELYGTKPFRAEYAHHDMARFAQAAAALTTNLLNEFLLRLGNDGAVLEKLRAVAAFRFDVRSRSFQEIALPLLRLLASRAFVESVHVADVKRVLRVVAVGEPLFLRRALHCLQRETQPLRAAGLLAASAESLASVLHAVVRKLPDCALDDELYALAQSVAAWVAAPARDDDGDATALAAAAATLRDTLDMCEELVPSRRPADEAAAPGAQYRLVDGIRALTLTTAEPEHARDGFARGPRHDNDAAAFRDVAVIPTDLEMRCLEDPHLPARPRAAAPFETHLDFHFRLLREDVLAQLRRGVQWVLRPETLAECARTQRWTPPRAADVPQLHVAQRVRLDALAGAVRKGVMLRVSGAQPRLATQSKAALRAFWEKEQRFKPGSLVCIAADVTPGQHWVVVGDDGRGDDGYDGGDDDAFPRYAALAAGELVFATVCDSEPAAMAADLERFSVGLTLLETHRTAALVPLLTDRKREHLLFEVRGLFFPAYEPVLRALQRHDARHSVAPALRQCLYGDGDGGAWQRRPAYLASRETYDLQFLVRADAPHRVDLSRVPAADYAQLVRHLSAHERRGCLTLDASQVEAFAAALTQQASLIQGPPGTGKSYVGTKIVRGILQQTRPTRREIGPVLCVCYTNHALDQFLEGLVADGVPLDTIVRVGARSKSELLQPRALAALKHAAGGEQSRQERTRFYDLREQCASIEEHSLKRFVAETTSPAAFLRWLQAHDGDAYAEIVGLADRDGFQEQGQSTQDHRTRWRACTRGGLRPRVHARGLWAEPLAARTARVAAWEDEWRASTRGSIEHALAAYTACVDQVKAVDNARLLRVLRESHVVGVTTTGAAMHAELLRALAPAVVVCEEAGEVLEAHLLACLSPATQQLIQIGDHLQLRPILNEYALTVDAPPRVGLDVSMFERLVGARGTAAPGALVTLHVQRRMRPPICDLVRHTLYPQLEDGPQVQQYPDARGFTHNLWFLDHGAPESAARAVSHTNVVEAELVVELVAYAVKQGYDAGAIAVLTPYLGQLVEIRTRLQARSVRAALDDRDVELLRAAGVRDAAYEEANEAANVETTERDAVVVVKSMGECVRLSTVDNFQGNEADVVVVSTVRSNAAGATGFLKTANRVNVMLSRARHAMFVLGSAATVRRSPQAEMLNRVLDMLEDAGCVGPTIGLRCHRHGTVVQAASARDIRERAPDGGCLERCDQRLRCGHGCAKLCHADDPRHVAGVCLEPCARRVAACGHLCQARCHERCRCRETVPRHTLPCGHTLRDVACASLHSGTPLVCLQRIDVALPFCGHSRSLPCAQARTLQRHMDRGDWAAVWHANVACDAACDGTAAGDCGHACRHKCGQCLASRLGGDAAMLEELTRPQLEAAATRRTVHFGACTHPCARALLCGHACAGVCHAASACPPCEAPCRAACVHSRCPRPCKDVCASCAEPCAWTCAHDACELPCGSPCTRLPCDARCPKPLAACGHACPGLCGEPCLPSAFCRACPPHVATQRDEVVDLVMQTTLAAHDPDESPLVRLRCGHCFTVETLDGWLGLATFYEQDRAGRWVGATPLRAPQDGAATLKGCPTCRAPIAGVLRYGRPANFFALHQSELKHLQAAMAAIAASAATRRQHQQQQQRESSEADAEKQRNKLIAAFERLVRQETPTQEVSTKEASRLARRGLDGDALNLHAFRGIMQSQAAVLLGLELLALLVAKLSAASPSTRPASAARHAFRRGVDEEARVLATARASAAHRSTRDALLLGMELRVAFLSSGYTDEQQPPLRGDHITRELRQSLDALRASGADSGKQQRAQQLWATAGRAGALTKAEKDAIFRVFAKGNDAFAQGFGGRWYQCPSGHPYVITECGGAMETARCPECGATIGGTSHRLDASNAPATAFFQ